MLKQWMRLAVWLFGAEAVTEESGRIVWNPVVEHADRINSFGERLKAGEKIALEQFKQGDSWSTEEYLADIARRMGKTCMSLTVCRESDSVELVLDTSLATYMDSVDGVEGADCGLLLDCDTDAVVGIKLPLKNKRLVVHHEGPIRINTGFWEDEDD